MTLVFYHPEHDEIATWDESYWPVYGSVPEDLEDTIELGWILIGRL